MENISSGFEMEEASGSEGTRKPSTTSQWWLKLKTKQGNMFNFSYDMAIIITEALVRDSYNKPPR